ncbi:MAG TPA: ligase [Burkholderiaceae bacterium]|nr:ligase [Burkholderiaceae bacterium]
MEKPYFRIWTYPSPAIVLGCSQNSLHEDVQRRAEGRVECIKREAGGAAVLTGPWLVSASVVLPNGHPWIGSSVVDTYRRLGELHVAALREYGVPASALPPQEVPRASALNSVGVATWACFGGLSPWEVVNAEGRKLVGLAQRRRRSGVLLVAGTLINSPDWHLLCDAMGYPEHEPVLRQCTVAMEEITGSPIEPERFASMLNRLLEQAL